MRKSRINPVSAKQKEELKQRRLLKGQLIIESGGRCQTCGGVGDWLGLSLSHIIPLSRGGKTERGNCLIEDNTCHTLFEKHPERRPEWQRVKYNLGE